MKTKYLVPALAVPVLALTLLGANAVSAQGGWGADLSSEEIVKRQQTMFENQASILGVNVSEVKDAWAQGKGLKELAQEKGIREDDLKAKLQAEHKKQHEAHLKALVDAGVITQSQADQRLQFMEKKQTEMKEKRPPREGRSKGMGQRMGGGRQPQ